MSQTRNAPKEFGLIVLLALTFSLTFVWWHQDDLYIHLQYVKHLIDYGEWSFSKGTTAYGTTSQIWVILIAAIGALSNIGLIALAKGLSVLFGVLTIVPIYFSRKYFADNWAFHLCVIGVLLNHWYRLSSGSGMEATLSGFLMTVVFVMILPQKPKQSWRMFVLGLLSASCLLTRPELLFLPVVMLFYFDRRKQLFVKQLVLYSLGYFVVLLPWLVYAYMHFGTVIPNTVIIKAGGHLNLQMSSIVSSFSRITLFYLPSNGIHLLGILLYCFARSTKRVSTLDLGLTHWLLVFSLPAIYFVNALSGGTDISYRYAAPTLPIIILVGSLCIDKVAASWKTHKNAILVAAALLIVVGNVSLSIVHWPFLKESVNYVETVLVKYGKWLNANSAPSDTVACYDVGAIGYYSERHVLDLIGLNSLDAYSMRKVGMHQGFENWTAVHHYHPRWFISQLTVDSVHTLGNLHMKFRIVMKDEVPDYRLAFSRKLSKNPIYLVELDQ